MSTEVVVAVGADEGYALPLAVAGRSLIDRLAASARLRLIVLDGGISASSRDRLLDTWRDPRVEIDWRRPSVAALREAPVSGHVTAAAYLRLLLPDLVEADRLLYLDADTLVRRDVGLLWDEPLASLAVRAAQDLAAPWIDAEVAADRFAERLPLLAAARPVANYRELGMRPEAPYFNSGVMDMNLALWREERVADRVLRCLRDNAAHVLWWDQYALNVVLEGRWGALDPRWNQGAQVYAYPSWRLSPVDRPTFDALRRDPWIVHFCSPDKPWLDGCRHPFRAPFFETLDRTAWRGWRPKPDAKLRLRGARESRRRLKQRLRWSLRGLLGGGRNRAA